jgi:hypothetical protein
LSLSRAKYPTTAAEVAAISITTPTADRPLNHAHLA